MPPPWWSQPCPAGFEPTEPDGACVICPKGTWQETFQGQQKCRPCESGTVQPYAGQLSCLHCPRSGVDCKNSDAVDVLPGYYMKAQDNISTIEVWQCAREQACLGGEFHGNKSCAEGHEGPLCGTCEASFYRSRLRCEPCAGYAGREGSVRNSIFILTTAGAIITALASVYLIRGGRQYSATADNKPHAEGRCQSLQRFASLLYQRAVTGATIARIALGYSQCLSMHRRFLRVRWPDLFSHFLRLLDQLTLEIFDLVPAECALGRRLGFYVELGATLVTPLLLMIGLFTLAIVVAPCSKRGCCDRTLLMTWPQIWDLAVWLILIQFPTISRKTLSMFDCVQYEGSWLLRADPGIRCDDRQSQLWSMISGGGAAFYCLGVPLVTFLISFQFHSASPARQRLVQVLTRSYVDSCWYMESVDLLRKFLLTGVINVFFPQTKTQLWFGMTISLFFLLMHQRLMPFGNHFCNAVQFAAHLQLVFTYMTSLLFFVEDLADAQSNEFASNQTFGTIMILANCGAFMMIIFTSVHGVRKLVAEMRETRLTWYDGAVVHLLPPRIMPRGYHLFVSHNWRYGQDQAGTIKSTLRSIVPSCITFLDVDDLEHISKLEEYVRVSDVILIIVTDLYLSSINCRRELVAAFKEQKPIVLLLETDPSHGATNVLQLRAELDAMERNGNLPKDDHDAAERMISLLDHGDNLSADIPAVIEWYREKDLRMAACKLIVANVLKAQPLGARQARRLDDMHFVEEHATSEKSRSAQQRFSTRRKERKDKSKELDLYVQPLVGDSRLELRFTGLAMPFLELPGLASSEVQVARYEVIGPPAKMQILNRLMERAPKASGAAPSVPTGLLSPMEPVNIPAEQRAPLGIPPTAAYFAFSYPAEDMSSALDGLSLSSEPWGFMLLIGGFLYFDEALEVVGVNALTFAETPFCFHFKGPYPAANAAVAALNDQARIADITLRGLQEQGFQGFGWLHPSEKPGGHALSADVAYEYGAFVYRTSGSPCFYTLRLATEDGGLAKESSSTSIKETSSPSIKGLSRFTTADEGVLNVFSSLKKRAMSTKVEASLTAGTVYLSPHYQGLFDSRANASVFDSLSAVLVESNIDVSTERAEGRPAVVFLCPGVFDDAGLLRDIQHTLTGGLSPPQRKRRLSVEARQLGAALGLVSKAPSATNILTRLSGRSSGRNSGTARVSYARSSARKSSTEHAARNATIHHNDSWHNLRVAQKLKSGAALLGEKNLYTSQKQLNVEVFSNTPMIPLYSTARTFDWYMTSCPQSLKDDGIFGHLFAKWPVSLAMQEVVATKMAEEVRKLAAEAPKGEAANATAVAKATSTKLPHAGGGEASTAKATSATSGRPERKRSHLESDMSDHVTEPPPSSRLPFRRQDEPPRPKASSGTRAVPQIGTVEEEEAEGHDAASSEPLFAVGSGVLLQRNYGEPKLAVVDSFDATTRSYTLTLGAEGGGPMVQAKAEMVRARTLSDESASAQPDAGPDSMAPRTVTFEAATPSSPQGASDVGASNLISPSPAEPAAGVQTLVAAHAFPRPASEMSLDELQRARMSMGAIAASQADRAEGEGADQLIEAASPANLEPMAIEEVDRRTFFEAASPADQAATADEGDHRTSLSGQHGGPSEHLDGFRASTRGFLQSIGDVSNRLSRVSSRLFSTPEADDGWSSSASPGSRAPMPVLEEEEENDTMGTGIVLRERDGEDEGMRARV